MKGYMKEKEARKLICEIGRRMYEKGFVAANDGNISIRTGGDEMICTPSGVSKGFMKEYQLVKTDLEGKPVDSGEDFNVNCGSLSISTAHVKRPVPSSEIRLHGAIYQKNPKLRAVVHAHPPISTAFAVSGLSLEEAFMTESLAVLGPIPLAPYAPAGTEELAQNAAAFCLSHKGVLLANHGAATWSENPLEAWYLMESLEHSAKIYLHAKYILGNVNFL